MRPASPPSISSYKLETRLHNWRIRQNQQHPSLFRTSLHTPPSSPPVSLHNLRSGRSQLHISSTPMVICDACAILIKLSHPTTSSSASTLSPNATVESDVFTCPCGFVTPTGMLRCLMGLPDDRGPDFERGVVRSLLIEAIGVIAAVKVKDQEFREWALDEHCRESGLAALCRVLGITEEEVGGGGEWDGAEAEAFLERLPKEVMPRVPFSVADLRGGHEFCSDEDCVEGMRRVREITGEAGRLWRGGLGVGTVEKMKELGEEYVTQRRKVRMYLNRGGRGKYDFSVTQSGVQSSKGRQGGG